MVPKGVDHLPLKPILAAVKTLLRGCELVELPEHGIDLLFDDGVIARCRACSIAWPVKRSRFSSAEWWICPSGCAPPALDAKQQAG